MAIRNIEELERVVRIGAEYATEKIGEHRDDEPQRMYYEGEADAYQRMLLIMTTTD